MATAVDRSVPARNEHMTFRANMGVGRHGWLRLTPAYGVRLVRDRLAYLPPGSVVTDPFSGTGTTPLAAAELGHFGQSVDVNPFLIWLGRVKTSHYAPRTLAAAADAARETVAAARARPAGDDGLWQPGLFRIEKWWRPGALHALKALRASIDSYEAAGVSAPPGSPVSSGSVRPSGAYGDHGGAQVKDLLELALCRCLISCSNAAFDHQSMSFKRGAAQPAAFEPADAVRTFDRFGEELAALLDSARYDLLGSADVHQGDSREGVRELREADLVLTSPPYVNRMSYIRELRPYMYWLRHLDRACDAGDLDWRAIGGTWGTATSRLASWAPHTATPVDDAVAGVCRRIAEDGGRYGPLLARYVHKYHHDMWLHFQAVAPGLKRGGAVSYIVGNSTFYGHEVPVPRWYAAMLRALGYRDVAVTVIRKRNSNKALFEYEVTGIRP